MSNQKFIADVERFAQVAERKMLGVARQSIDDVVRDAQTPVAKGGSMPIDTGTLRNSLVTELNASQVAEGSDSYILGLTRFKLGDTITVAWTADYAIPRHYKPESFGQGGGMWRDKAAAKWQTFVIQNARRADSLR